MCAKKKKNNGIRSSQPSTKSSIDGALRGIGMTEAEVSIYLFLYRRLPEICSVPEIKAKADYWLHPEVLSDFHEYFSCTSFSEESSPRFRTIPQIDVHRYSEKCQRAVMLLSMLMMNSLSTVDDFLALQRTIQLSLIEVITGIPDPGQFDEYLSLVQCIENFQNLGRLVDTPMSKVKLNSGIVSDLILLWQEYPIGFKTKEVFQKLVGLGFDETMRFAWLYPIADTGIMEEMILNDAFKTIGDLEKAYLNLKSTKTKPIQI